MCQNIYESQKKWSKCQLFSGRDQGPKAVSAFLALLQAGSLQGGPLPNSACQPALQCEMGSLGPNPPDRMIRDSAGQNLLFGKCNFANTGERFKWGGGGLGPKERRVSTSYVASIPLPSPLSRQKAYVRTCARSTCTYMNKCLYVYFDPCSLLFAPSAAMTKFQGFLRPARSRERERPGKPKSRPNRIKPPTAVLFHKARGCKDEQN